MHVKNIVRKLTTLRQQEFLRELLEKFKNTKIFTNSYKRQEAEYLANLMNKYKKISKLVVKNRVDVIFINGDRHSGYEPVFLKIANEFRIPTIIPCLVDFADEERIFRNNILTKQVKKSICTSKYIVNSQNNLKYKFTRGCYYYPHFIGNALDKFGVITLNPNVMGSGKSDFLCLNSRYYEDLYVKNGVKKEKVRVVGDISYDELYNKFIQKVKVKKVVLSKYNLDEKKNIIIVALPQLGEHGMLSWDRHWEEVDFLIKNIDKVNQNILISLHPKMCRKNYIFLEKKYNCRVLNERLVEVLVAADLFIATYSSTVAWSVLCGIKTLVVDFYGLNYTMYDFLVSIKKVKDKELFLGILRKALEANVDFGKDWERLSRDDVFNGNALEKYIDLIYEVVEIEQKSI
jgi:hypothetical protein